MSLGPEGWSTVPWLGVWRGTASSLLYQEGGLFYRSLAYAQQRAKQNTFEISRLEDIRTRRGADWKITLIHSFEGAVYLMFAIRNVAKRDAKTGSILARQIATADNNLRSPR